MLKYSGIVVIVLECRNNGSFQGDPILGDLGMIAGDPHVSFAVVAAIFERLKLCV